VTNQVRGIGELLFIVPPGGKAKVERKIENRLPKKGATLMRKTVLS